MTQEIAAMQHWSSRGLLRISTRELLLCSARDALRGNVGVHLWCKTSLVSQVGGTSVGLANLIIFISIVLRLPSVARACLTKQSQRLPAGGFCLTSVTRTKTFRANSGKCDAVCFFLVLLWPPLRYAAGPACSAPTSESSGVKNGVILSRLPSRTSAGGKLSILLVNWSHGHLNLVSSPPHL